MIYVSDLQQLTNLWQERMHNASQPFDYKEGINECLYDLNQLINRSIDEDMTYEDFLEQEADKYLSNADSNGAVA